MDNAFIYEWHELTKGRRLTAKLILQAILLAVIVGFGPELVLMLMGYAPDIYQMRYMIVVIPVVVIISVISYWNNPIAEITTSSLAIENNIIRVTRHVITETGRRFFAVWDSIEIKGYKVDEYHRVIQIDAKWSVSAYRLKGTDIGNFVDSDVRSHPQTFQFAPEAFYKATEYLEKNHFDMITEMTAEEYEKAKPFIHKHYEI